MPVPNTLIRIIAKNGQVVPFEMSRIHNAIAKTIEDVEGASSWEAKERSLKYAELVKERIYNSFYHVQYIASFFSRMILKFEANERKVRVARPEFGPRLATLFLLHFSSGKHLDPLKPEIKKEHEADLLRLIERHFSLHITDQAILKETAELFVEKVIEKAKQGVTMFDQYPCRNFIQDTIEQTLKDIGEISIAEGFMIFREGKKKIKSGEIAASQFTNNGYHEERVRQTLLWNIQNECDSVFALNDWVLGRNGKDFKELMRRCDARFYEDITQTVKKIMERADDIKVVIIAGPSSSNKTTTTAILAQELAKHGLKLKQLNVDDYFFNLSEHPKDEFGDYDYEMPEALDMKLLNENLRDLVQGKVIKKPCYNFKTGGRDGYVDFSIEKNDIVLIDCLHGLFKKLTEAVPSEKKFTIFTEASNMLRSIDGSYTKWTDVRLARRMIRDSLFRYYDVKRTLEHWAYVRKGELKHIIPYIYSVDMVLNSGLPYELPILKTVLKDKMPSDEYLKDLRKQGRLDAYIRGVRLKALFDTIVAFDKLDEVSAYSPIREFIGGSAYDLAHNK